MDARRVLLFVTHSMLLLAAGRSDLTFRETPSWRASSRAPLALCPAWCRPRPPPGSGPLASLRERPEDEEQVPDGQFGTEQHLPRIVRMPSKPPNPAIGFSLTPVTEALTGATAKPRGRLVRDGIQVRSPSSASAGKPVPSSSPTWSSPRYPAALRRHPGALYSQPRLSVADGLKGRPRIGRKRDSYAVLYAPSQPPPSATNSSHHCLPALFPKSPVVGVNGSRSNAERDPTWFRHIGSDDNGASLYAIQSSPGGQCDACPRVTTAMRDVSRTAL